ncbi:hypothetical protein CHGG_03033 [Chaetomium globosum CBS 148.51]|uniref:Uncharacterized protein n=1 Tax=Chaetomium globosum (strain ATCC 6205 / CBS 148.51 / DSM 1962 / NBRC 6347 / NRRL 1970) TaxID=306901 RepID=Q2H9S1_CHAGB|nr:uncharacterized protein CHGG_03033 [Chaetomium globosum CBS 148.51]EAQ91098.1 hypothetical protein CHGG_03033 [Chaetomium globosum CBS 148.51]
MSNRRQKCSIFWEWFIKREPSLRWADSHGESTGWIHAGTILASHRTREELGVWPCRLWERFWWWPGIPFSVLRVPLAAAGAELEDG